MLIDLMESAEQAQIAGTMRRFLAERLPVGRFRTGGGEGDGAILAELAGLGALGISAPEAVGGLALGLADEAIVFRELGRAAATPSLVASWLALRICLAAGDTGRAERLVAGTTHACIALPGGGTLLDRQGAGLAVAVEDARFHLLDIGAAVGAPVGAVDWLTPVERIAAPAVLHQAEDPALAAALDLVVSAMLAGLAEAARDLAVDYARVREQFGRPIGAFQAIKHKCADLELRCATAWSQVAYAALILDAGDPSGAYAVTAARILATDAAIENAEAGIQIHGGLGFTAECEAHVFLKRARTLARIGTPAAECHERLLAMAAPGRVGGAQ